MTQISKIANVSQQGFVLTCQSTHHLTAVTKIQDS